MKPGQQTGVPESPADVDPDHCIAVLEPGAHCAQEWLFRGNSETYAILPTAPLAFSDGDSAIAAAVHGGGYARVFCIEAEQQIASGLLQPVLSNWNDASQPVAMVHARHRHVSKEVLAFRAFMASIFPSDMTRYLKSTIYQLTPRRTSASGPIAKRSRG